MDERCPTGFDEGLISGHIDGELTQAVEQRVRIHLEDCEHCRALRQRLAQLREVTMATELELHGDLAAGEAPRTALSHLSRGLGWVLGVVWLAAVSGYGLWLATQDITDLFGRLLLFGGLTAGGLLLLSVLLDRLRDLQHDKYRGVDR